MLVLHLSTSEAGGAGLAAARLAAAQARNGINVIIHSNKNRTANKKNPITNFWTISKSKLTTATNRLMTKRNIPAQSFISVSTIDRKKIISINPEVIHIHNWYNLLSLDDLNFLVKNFSCVFTMHDMRLLTGGCHYSLDCINYETTCRNCPQTRTSLNFNSIQRKRLDKIFCANQSRYAIVTPSTWLRNLALEHSIGRNALEVLMIPNAMDSQNFGYSDALLQRNGIRTHKLLFVSHDLTSPVKGLDLLLTALLVLLEKHNLRFHLTTVGFGFDRVSVNSMLDVTNIEKCNSHEMQHLMISHDALVVPSRNDNSPNVILEAQSSGLLVIASSVGGVRELVVENQTGFTFDPNIDSLVSSLLNFHNASNLDAIRINAKDFFQRRNNEEEIVANHINLYKRLRNEK